MWFTSHESRNNAHERLSLQEMANSVLAVTRAQSGAIARIGVSASHRQPGELVHAYLEACSALDSADASVCFFKDSATRTKRPVEALERLWKAIQQGSDATVEMREFLVHGMPADHSLASIQKSRALLTWAIEHMALDAISLGAEQDQLDAAKQQSLSGVLNAPSPFSACEAFRRFAYTLAQQVASTFSHREQKIVRAIRTLVEKKGIAQIKIKDLSDALHLSTGHISRVFRRTTGMTLEEFLIRQRVELAKRTLLDPRLNVAEVAERCGFCNPAYFASVFRKYVNCTPRQFASQPQLWTPISTEVSPRRVTRNGPALEARA
jgi:AraC-like DNA-binding protein